MAIDPNTGLDDGEDFQAQIARNVAQARAAGIPIMDSMPGMGPGAMPGVGAPVDPTGVQRALAQAKQQGVPPGLAAPAPQGPGLGAMGVPGMPMMSMFPPQPARREVERSTTTNTRREMGAEEKAAVGQLSQGYDDQIAAQGRKDFAAANRATVEADNADVLAGQQEARALRRQNLVAEGEKQLTQAMTLYKGEFEKYRKMDIKDYFSGDQGTARGVFAALAVMAGELGRMRPGAGGENIGVQLVNQEIQKDFTRQKLAIEKQRDVLQQAGENMETVQRWHTHAMNMLELKEAAAYDAVMARNTSNLKALGVSEAEAQGDAANAVLRTQKAEAIQRVFEGTRRQISGTVEKQLVENQGMPGMGGGYTPMQQYTIGRQVREDAEKDQKRVVKGWDGQPVGMAADEGEARGLRDALGPSRNIVGQLDSLAQEVEQLGFIDRAVPSFSSKQQRIAGKLDTMLGPMTQALGSGTPQEAEAKRKLQALSSSVMQDPKTAVANVRDLQGFLRSNYEEQLRAKVIGGAPAQQAAPPAAAAPAGGDQGVIKRVNGKRWRVYSDGTGEPLE